jgi:hypothetical protein
VGDPAFGGDDLGNMGKGNKRDHKAGVALIMVAMKVEVVPLPYRNGAYKGGRGPPCTGGSCRTL